MQLRTDIFGSARARRNCAFPEGERFLTYEETIQGIPTALWEEQRRGMNRRLFGLSHAAMSICSST
jgi:hypothetical protein